MKTLMADQQDSGGNATNELLRNPMVQALLVELSTKLAALARGEQVDNIDLRRLPLPPGGLEAMRRWLGKGEVSATVSALGTTTVQETATAGIWWVSQAKASGEPIGDTLEIAECPALLVTHADDILAAAEQFRVRLALLMAPQSPGCSANSG